MTDLESQYDQAEALVKEMGLGEGDDDT